MHASECSLVAGLGVEDAAGFLKGRYGGAGLLQLQEVYVGEGLLQQLQAAVDEAVVTHSFVDTAVSGSTAAVPTLCS